MCTTLTVRRFVARVQSSIQVLDFADNRRLDEWISIERIEREHIEDLPDGALENVC